MAAHLLLLPPLHPLLLLLPTDAGDAGIAATDDLAGSDLASQDTAGDAAGDTGDGAGDEAEGAYHVTEQEVALGGDGEMDGDREEEEQQQEGEEEVQV
jgi:hypothetical protein